MRLDLRLPLPPSVNHAYFTAHNGQRILTPKAKDWMIEASFLASRAVRHCKWEVQDKDVKLVMELTFRYPDRRRRDSHNMLKLLLDGLEKVLYIDDKMVLPKIMDFTVDKDMPCVDIVLYEK